jgi:DNA gyrase subunit A
VLAIIKTELLALKEKHATPRLTEIVPDEGEIAIEDLIANEGVIITLTHNGLIKRTSMSSYRSQRRGGKGVIGMATRETSAVEGDEADFIEHLFTASTHDYLMFFTNSGRVYVERVHEVPDMARTAKGRSIANLLELKADEKVAAMIRVESKLGPNKEDVTGSSPASSSSPPGLAPSRRPPWKSSPMSARAALSPLPSSPATSSSVPGSPRVRTKLCSSPRKA